jgi:hypothetical protein
VVVVVVGGLHFLECKMQFLEVFNIRICRFELD